MDKPKYNFHEIITSFIWEDIHERMGKQGNLHQMNDFSRHKISQRRIPRRVHAFPFLFSKGIVCKVRTQDPENFHEEVKSLVTAWCT